MFTYNETNETISLLQTPTSKVSYTDCYKCSFVEETINGTFPDPVNPEPEIIPDGELDKITKRFNFDDFADDYTPPTEPSNNKRKRKAEVADPIGSLAIHFLPRKRVKANHNSRILRVVSNDEQEHVPSTQSVSKKRKVEEDPSVDEEAQDFALRKRVKTQEPPVIVVATDNKEIPV
jgi:hypothetical protein